jgi:hypothetical protein
MRRSTLSPQCLTGARFMSKLKSCGVIGKAAVELPSKWNWNPFCEQFAKIVHAPTLNIPTGAPLLPSVAVFARIPINDNFMLNPPKDKKIDEHCEIEKVMKQVGVPLSYHSHVRTDLWRMLNQLAIARQEEVRPTVTRNAEKIDRCTMIFLQLCGFGDDPFEMTRRVSKVKIFGKTSREDTGCNFVVTPHNDRILIFGDQSLNEEQILQKQGHLGQIVGEMLQAQSLSRDNNKLRNVFAVRFVKYRVTLFRVEAVPTTLNAIFDENNVPAKKLKLLCTEKNPAMGLGLSLIDPKERVKALRVMADIRRLMLNPMKE